MWLPECSEPLHPWDGKCRHPRLLAQHLCSRAPRSTHLLWRCWVLTAWYNFWGNKWGEQSRFYIGSMILILPPSLQFSLESLILTTLDAALGEWNLNYNVWRHMICDTDPPQSVGSTFMTPFKRGSGLKTNPYPDQTLSELNVSPPCSVLFSLSPKLNRTRLQALDKLNQSIPFSKPWF
jgi:hypothetical protein